MSNVNASRETATPRHVGVVMDGNRRWARIAGNGSPKLWPDFGEPDLGEALAQYATCAARAGGAPCPPS